jgi:hypothetical protein
MLIWRRGDVQRRLSFALAVFVLGAAAIYVVWHLPEWFVLYVENVPARISLAILVLIFISTLLLHGYYYFFPPAAIVRANIAWWIAAWGSLTGVPLTAGIFVLRKLNVFGENVIQVELADVGLAAVFVTTVSLVALFAFQLRYERLLRPENVGWATVRPKLR